jgi:WD40 repeat protein
LIKGIFKLFRLLKLECNYDNLSSHVSKLNGEETLEMLKVKHIPMNNTNYIAVCLYGGFKLWSYDGSRLIYQIPCKVKQLDKPYAFTAVIHYKYNMFDKIIAGDNYGSTYLISGSGLNWKSKLLYNYENGTTTALAYYSDNIFISYETGEIHGIKLKNESSIEIIVKLDNPLGLPCLTLAVIDKPKPRLAGGYANGEIKVYNIGDNYDLCFSISAHLRMITSLTSFDKYLVSCGDDCYVNVWKIEENIEIHKNIEIPDKMHIGVQVFPNNGKAELFITSYDSSSFSFIEDFIN